MNRPGFREPAESLQLRFGSYRGRYLVALALLFAGGGMLQLASAYTLGLALAGFLASVAGWIVVPGPGARRAIVIVPAVLGVAALLGGAQAGVLLALTLASWLFVRMRPALTYLLLVVPVTASYLLGLAFPHYGDGVVVGAVLAVALIASAWLARLVAVHRRRTHFPAATEKTSPKMERMG